MANKIGLLAYISGRVQGVWFRRNTQEKAEKLNLSGFAKNLADGRVEVRAFGEQQAIEELISWLHQGPSLAKVKSVTINYIAFSNMEDFSIK